MAYFLGVDVGTASVRAVLIDENGQTIDSQSEKLEIFRPKIGRYEQSTDQIWEAICSAVKTILKRSKVETWLIKGIGFDATCSLVLLNSDGQPVSLQEDTNEVKGDYIANVIMWLDHRAVTQAERINTAAHPILRYVGGRISPEMQPSKILWLKENQPEIFPQCQYFMDLADWLTYAVTGNSKIRSACTLNCKWLYRGDNTAETEDFWKSIDLLAVCESNVTGVDVLPPGTIVGQSDPTAGNQLGLGTHSVAVGVGMIDAMAGCLGCLATSPSDGIELSFPSRFSMICGTSTCHLVLSRTELFIPAIWGPYDGAVLPDLYLNEAGQNAVGPILDWLITSQAADIPQLKDLSLADGHSWLVSWLEQFESRNGPLALAQLTSELHIWPDYRGNRAPLAEPNMTGTIMGLKLPGDVDAIRTLAALYLGHIQSFAYTTRFIMESLQTSRRENNDDFKVICMCGGLSANRFYRQSHADVTLLPVLVPNCTEPVAYGAAMLGAVASGHFGNSNSVVKRLQMAGSLTAPNTSVTSYHNWKYRIFRQLGQLQLEAKNSQPSTSPKST